MHAQKSCRILTDVQSRAIEVLHFSVFLAKQNIAAAFY